MLLVARLMRWSRPNKLGSVRYHADKRIVENDCSSYSVVLYHLSTFGWRLSIVSGFIILVSDL